MGNGVEQRFVARLTLLFGLMMGLLFMPASRVSAGLVDPNAPGLLRLLYFDGDARDATDTENGLIVGDPLFPSSGCIDGGCLELNGNDAVVLPTLFDVVPPQWSIELWVKLHQFPPATECVFFTGKRQSGHFIEHYIGITALCGNPDPNKFRFFSWAGIEHPFIEIVAPDTALLNHWYLLTFTFDGTHYRGYVNTREVGYRVGPPIPHGAATDFRIGGRDVLVVDYFVHGRIDEFAAHARALSTAEVQGRYLTGALNALAGQVVALLPLTEGQRSRLLALLKAAMGTVTRSNTVALCNLLGGFMRMIGSLSDRIGADTAASLVNQTQMIRLELSCS